MRPISFWLPPRLWTLVVPALRAGADLLANRLADYTILLCHWSSIMPFFVSSNLTVKPAYETPKLAGIDYQSRNEK